MSAGSYKYLGYSEIYKIKLILIIMMVLLFSAISDIYKDRNMVKNFNQILENLFVPIFEATLDPSSHPYLSKFLNQVL